MIFSRQLLVAATALSFSAQAALSLTIKPNVAPVVSGAIGDRQIFVQTTGVIDLSAFFSDPDASAAVRLVTSLGNMKFTLDGQTAPLTVANFLNYVTAGNYFKIDPTDGHLATTFFHRSVTNFVIQAGGFVSTVNPNSPLAIQPTEVAAFGAVPNEPFISNQRGTIAMAKLGGEPNSATSQWFINLADNSANLDSQNGGFTVFGRVAGSDMAVADAIAAVPKYNFGSPFDSLPLRNYNGTQVVGVNKLISIPEFTQISPFNFSASSNNGAVAGVRVSGTNLLIDALQAGQATITVIASDLDGASVSQNFNVSVSTTAGHLYDISTRANFPVGNEVLIGGFTIDAGAAKQVVVRALGPSLANYGITNALPDPTLELHDASGAIIATNDNWNDGPNSQLVSDLRLDPPSAKEPAVLITLPASTGPSAFTAIMRSGTGETGIGLVEVYDIASGPSPNLQNLSTRGEVGTGNNIMIGGFILRGNDSRRLVVRVRGPELTDYGVSGALADPKIDLRDSQGALVGSNDNWQAGANAGEIDSNHLAPKYPSEPALIATLAPGGYTALVTGVGPSPTGVALIELYRVQ